MSNMKYDEWSDAELVGDCLQGERAAFGELVVRHRPRVVRFLYSILSHPFDVEDVVQEAFLQAYLCLSQLRSAERFGSWVYGIAFNLAQMRLRTAGRMIRHLEEKAAVLVYEANEQMLWRLPEAAAVRQAERNELHIALEHLPPGEREALQLVYLGELSQREAAARLNLSLNALKVRLHRGRERLRQNLALPTQFLTMKVEDHMIEVIVDRIYASISDDDQYSLAFNELKTERTLSGKEGNWLGKHRVVLLKEKAGPRAVPIWIGPAEGELLIFHLSGKTPIRPFTFDLTKELLRLGGLTLKNVAINRLHETIYYGSLNLHKTNNGLDNHEVDCRPSDAINLAVRLDVPIFIDFTIMADMSVVPNLEGVYELSSETLKERFYQIFPAVEE